MSARVHVCEYVCGRMGMDAYVGSAQHARACACACAGEGTCACMHRYEGVREGKWVYTCACTCADMWACTWAWTHTWESCGKVV